MKTAVSASRLFFLFVSLSFSLLHSSTAATTTAPAPTNNHHIIPLNATKPAPPSAEIQKGCSIAKDKAFCIQVLGSNPKSRGLDLKDLAFLAMTMAQDNGTATSKFVSQKMGDENELQPMLDETLGDCQDLYEDAGAMMENAMAAFFTKGKAEVTRWLSSAMTDAMNCEEELKKSGAQAAMGNRNQVFYNLVSSAWSVYDAAAPPDSKVHPLN